MNLRWAAGLALVCMGSSGADAQSGITLRAANFTNVPDHILIPAEKETVRILGQAGVRVAWLNCPDGPAVWGSHDPCQQELGPGEFWCHIVSRRPRNLTADALGFSVLDDSIGTSGYAGIDYARVEDLARHWQVDAYHVLATAVAHEIGHLLLGANSHSPKGIMTAHWGREHLVLASIGELLFTREQGERLRAEIARRTTTLKSSR